MDFDQAADELITKLRREASSDQNAKRITSAWLARFAAQVLDEEAKRLDDEALAAERAESEAIFEQSRQRYRKARAKKP